MSIRPTTAELVQLIHLEDVRFFELGGKVDWEAPEPEPEQDAGKENYGFQLGIGERADDRGVVAFFSVQWTRGISSASVKVGALYGLDDDVDEEIEYDEEVLREFVHRVAMFQLLPFAREGLLTTASRLRIEPPPVMPLMLSDEGPGALGEDQEAVVPDA